MSRQTIHFIRENQPTKSILNSDSNVDIPEHVDAVMPLHLRDMPTIHQSLDSAKKHVGIRNFYIIVSNKDDFDFSDRDDVILIKESDMSIPTVLDIEKSITEQEGPDWDRLPSWMYQQFIKLSACRDIEGLSNIYMIMDADVIFCKDYKPYSKGKSFYSVLGEHYPTYIKTTERILGRKRYLIPECEDYERFNFISHQMMFSRDLCNNMLSFIEDKYGCAWPEAILNGLFITETDPTCFSEYNLYANYCLLFHPDESDIDMDTNWVQMCGEVPPQILLDHYDCAYYAMHFHKRNQKFLVLGYKNADSLKE